MFWNNWYKWKTYTDMVIDQIQNVVVLCYPLTRPTRGWPDWWRHAARSPATPCCVGSVCVIKMSSKSFKICTKLVGNCSKTDPNKDARQNARARLEQRFGDQNVVQILQNWLKIGPKFVQSWPKMGCGAALGASGSQKTTREALKTIFASKMGGPGLQMGFFVGVRHHFKLKMR